MGERLPANLYGGTERVIWGLGYELTKMGHKVTYIVPEGSNCFFADVIEINHFTNINSIIPKNTDIVHFNFSYTDPIDYPKITTIHGNYDAGAVFEKNTVFVSKNHAERHHSNQFIHNGLLWEDYPDVDLNKNRKYLHYLAKASWKIKNLTGACEISVKTKNNLYVMGGERFKFYNFKRKPLFSLHPNIKYMGRKNNEEKVKIMEQSKGLLFPVLWHEPFGLAIIESLYCGCPVFGSKMGSLPELIHPEIGFLSDDKDEIINTILHYEYNVETCHYYAKENYNAKKMTDNYLQLYNKVIDGEQLNKENPYV